MFKYILIFAILIGGSLFTQAVAECMDCHSDEELTMAINDSVEVSLFVDFDMFQNSIHADLECIDCHLGTEDYEHEVGLPEVVCANCHEDSQEEYAVSIHAQAHERSPDIKVDCKNCHGTHNILSYDDENSMTYILNIENTCGECHSKPGVLAALGIRGDGPVKAYHASIHNKLLNEDVESGAPTCINCHDYHSIFVRTNPDSKFDKLHLSETCGECHTQELEDYEKSIHWKSVERGHFESPTCNDCHGEHEIMSPQNKDAVTNRLNISSQICANCHSSPTMMNRFSLDHERFATYSRTYHGLAVLGGDTNAANCTSCHEVHNIMSASNKQSSVHPDNLNETCSQCHENITAEFISIPVHPKDLETRNPTGFYIQNIYIWLIIITIGGMVIHNIIIYSYYIRKKRLALKNSRTYQRFQPFEVIQHGLLIVSFFTLVITGFALKFPDALWVQGLTSIGMTEETRSLIHRIAGVVLIVISFIQIGYFLFHKKGRREITELIPKISDITGFWQNIKFYLMKSDQHPKFGRWDYTEKAEYLALIWGTAVMALTGLVLWFPEFFISFLPFWMFEVSEIIHYLEAWLATLAIIIWHWFFVIYHPEKYPMSITWMDGKITEEELKSHHPLEYEELQNRKK